MIADRGNDEEFKADFEHIRIKTLLSGEYDKDNAIVTLHAGAGGTESCDWASSSTRMYLRWQQLSGIYHRGTGLSGRR